MTSRPTPRLGEGDAAAEGRVRLLRGRCAPGCTNTTVRVVPRVPREQVAEEATRREDRDVGG